jgi:hypothetical protein
MLVVEEMGNLNRDGNSFMISENIPREPKGDIPLSAKKSMLHSSEVSRGNVVERRKGKEMEDSSLSQPTYQKRRKLIFIDETEETQAPSKLHTRSSARRFPIPTIWPGLVECENREIDEKKVELGKEDADAKETKKQLNKSQHVIAQFYQENKELRRKLAETISETPVSQIQEGRRSPTSPTGGEKNISWLKKKLRDAQDVIIELREENMISKERIMEHFKECRPAIDDACASLSDAQSKLKRNAVLLRQVKSLNKQNLSLRKTIRDLRLQGKLEKEDKDKLNLLDEVV